MTAFEEQRSIALQKALSAAKQTNETYIVVALDDGAYGRDILHIQEAYAESDDFIAFDGAVLDIVHPDGSVE